MTDNKNFDLVLRLKKGTKLKGGENSHLNARVLKACDSKKETGRRFFGHNIMGDKMYGN